MIFVDTGAWIALTDRADQYHREASATYARLKQQRVRLVTTDYVLDETMTRLRYDSGHPQALRFIELVTQAERGGVLLQVSITPTLFQAALALFRQYDTVSLSFTDCTNFVVCEQYQIREAFAFDQHFLIRGIALYAP
ncbi:MAG: hypothetical protein A3F84_28770 [Candidatus Handelsmanbacteria bacterium RIFCSPLOWO2_12_FULL_64_10]|uniref:PIN domain-containing protein n=1 Tax=Handelsmanbacteria sp. (strain RIFCSPLOWO2_12_FULL_64_10) TaxID=1817868 RepID=A0A1F6C6E2_HANXR|nr:MAG: hypothetical protein A3F84_28770 [Candidatus Handelsmanbacteria bacterium RIFCSPLOWO2_12_FULL_64_10]